MKPWQTGVATFTLVFVVGMAAMWAIQRNERVSPAPPQPTSAAVPLTAPQENKMPALDFPKQLKVAPGTEKGWEFTGEFSGNFVTARVQLQGWFVRHDWRFAQDIALDETRELRSIYVFQRGQYELIVMLWKISTDRTGFSCRRQLIKPLNYEMIP